MMHQRSIIVHSKEESHKLTSLEFRSWKRTYVSEEALIQQLQKLQCRIVNRSARTSRVHQCDINDARVVIAWIFSEKKKQTRKRKL